MNTILLCKRVAPSLLMLGLLALPAGAGYSGWYQAGTLSTGQLPLGERGGFFYSRTWDGSQYNFHRAPLQADGSIGAWQATGVSNANGHYVLGEDAIYLHQKISGSTWTNACAYAPILADGSLGAWTDSTSTHEVRRNPSHVFHNDVLYVVGGNRWSNGPYLSSVEYAVVQPDGSLGTWQTAPSMNHARPNATALVHEGYLYAFGGGRHGYLTATVERAAIQADGSLGAWQVQPDMQLPQARYSYGSAVIDDVFYLLGGGTQTYGGGYRTDVLTGSFDELGDFSGWTAAETPLLHTRMNRPFVAGNRMYVSYSTEDLNIYTSEPLQETTAIPEPATMLAGLVGLAGVGRYVRRRKVTQ